MTTFTQVAVADLNRVGSISLNGNLTFGRTPGEASCVLPHPSVSKLHARITRAADGGMELRDLQSTNGTFVNGTRLSGAKRLQQGDQLRIGPFAFVVQGQTLEPLE